MTRPSPLLMQRGLLGLLAPMLMLTGAQTPALATQLPVAGVADPRVRVVDYTPDDVVLITATLGYAVTLDFGEEEKIETVSETCGFANLRTFQRTFLRTEGQSPLRWRQMSRS